MISTPHYFRLRTGQVINTWHILIMRRVKPIWIWIQTGHPLIECLTTLTVNILWHWILTRVGRDKIADILQTTLSNAFSWKKMFVFWIAEIPRGPIYNKVALVLAWHKSGDKHDNVEPNLWCHMTSLGHTVWLTQSREINQEGYGENRPISQIPQSTMCNSRYKFQIDAFHKSQPHPPRRVWVGAMS